MKMDNTGAAFKQIGKLEDLETAEKGNLVGAVNELFTSVGDGKNLLAGAIIDKEGTVPGTPPHSFAELEAGIRSIPQGPDVEGDALPAHVLEGKTFSSLNGIGLTGTMPNQGQKIYTPGPSNITIPAGYHDGTGRVNAVTFDASKVLTGTTIAGTSGTMPNQGQKIYTPGLTNITIPAGYHDGTGYVKGGFIGLSPGDDIIASSSDSVGTDSTTYTKMKEIRINLSGTVRVSFEMKSTYETAYAKIYVNSIPIGIERIGTAGDYIKYSEDISVSIGDLVQLYARAIPGRLAYVRLFQIGIAPFNGSEYATVII